MTLISITCSRETPCDEFHLNFSRPEEGGSLRSAGRGLGWNSGGGNLTEEVAVGDHGGIILKSRYADRTADHRHSGRIHEKLINPRSCQAEFGRLVRNGSPVDRRSVLTDEGDVDVAFSINRKHVDCTAVTRTGEFRNGTRLVSLPCDNVEDFQFGEIPQSTTVRK